MTEDGGPQRLSFEPKLFANVAQKKAIPIAELYKQLKKLSKELNGLEQETVDTQSLDSVTRQLLAPSLLRHKESGVVAYVACCIADILRLYAPEAPYSDDEIKAVFNVFIDQLQMLGDSNSQFFPLRDYLLTSLATVRTPALVAMLPDSEEIISRFFTALFGVVSPSQPHNIQMQILDILQQLLEEPKTVPQDVIDVILLQFTKRRQQDNPATHQLASDLANATADILQKYIYQYFNDVIVSAAQQRVGQRQQEADGQQQRARGGAAAGNDSLDDLKSAHYLILELNKSAPGTLLNVVPQLEEELGVDDVDIRILATGVLGEMFAEKGFTLAKRYESTWKTWKGRRADTSAVVRIQWIEHAVSLYQHQPQLSRELNDYIVEKLCDVDDKVRQVACHSLGLLEMSAPVQAAIGENVVRALGDRCKDRKPAVRSEAIIALATIYSQVFEELEQGAAAAQAKWGSIPSTIFMLRYINDPDIDSKVESILTGAILNFAKIKDDRSRCQRLLVVFDSLTAKARSGFFSYMRRQQDIIRLTDMFLALCEKQGNSTSADNAGGAVDQQLRMLAVKIAACFPDKAKVESSLSQLANLHDAEVYKGLRETMDAKNDIKAVRKYQKSSLKKLSGLAPSLLDTTAPLWKCVGLTTINRALVPFLIEHVSGGGRFVAAAEVLISYITSVFPEMLRSSSAELFDVAALQVADMTATEERLVLMVRFAKAIPKSVPRSTELENQLAAFVRTGSLKQAKYAAYLITQMDGAQSLCAALTGDVVDNLDNRHLERRAPSFAALARFAQYAPNAFSTYSDRVSQFLVQSVLLAAPVDGSADETEDWVSREALGEVGMTKVYATKILTSWLLGLERQALTRDGVQLVLGTLRQLVRNGGAMQEGGSVHERQHLLLTAAGCMLKLAAAGPHFEKALNTVDMLSLGLVVQNPCYEVRSGFLLNKLLPALVAQRIHVRYIPAVFLVAYEPEPAVRENVRHAVEQRLALMRPTPGSPSAVEDCICRLLYVLANHPDWDDTQPLPTLELFAPYIEFYISCVCLAQNVSLLFCYAGEIKAYRSKGDAVVTHRLYILSELAQYLLREKSLAANWPVNVYPGRLTLPADIFEPLPEADKAAMPRTPFLDPEFVTRRAKMPAAGKRSRVKPAGVAKIGKRRQKPAAASKRKGKAPALSDDDEDMEVADDDDEVAEDVEMSSVAETSDED
ncbi:Sister chromatid cohesion protein pds5 [Coemansia sp. S16]|nr:Sister chromatid cohesion protein pds5 [Coemansia sp. S680]KAJ2035666.1 Sister chromatid cohesion protein pds5 [Coemansia sp. S3946]KAJ2047766.1 Sister chromatid cohesion protein pds5 [Coemansia sp. S16]